MPHRGDEPQREILGTDGQGHSPRQGKGAAQETEDLQNRHLNKKIKVYGIHLSPFRFQFSPLITLRALEPAVVHHLPVVTMFAFVMSSARRDGWSHPLPHGAPRPMI